MGIPKYWDSAFFWKVERNKILIHRNEINSEKISKHCKKCEKVLKKSEKGQKMKMFVPEIYWTGQENKKVPYIRQN